MTGWATKYEMLFLFGVMAAILALKPLALRLKRRGSFVIVDFIVLSCCLMVVRSWALKVWVSVEVPAFSTLTWGT